MADGKDTQMQDVGAGSGELNFSNASNNPDYSILQEEEPYFRQEYPRVDAQNSRYSQTVNHGRSTQGYQFSNTIAHFILLATSINPPPGVTPTDEDYLRAVEALYDDRKNWTFSGFTGMRQHPILANKTTFDIIPEFDELIAKSKEQGRQIEYLKKAKAKLLELAQIQKLRLESPNNPDVNDTFLAEFAARFGGILPSKLTKEQLVRLCIEWATNWVKVRSRSIITNARDDLANEQWAMTSYKWQGFHNAVASSNFLVHDPNMAEDLLLKDVTLFRDRNSQPLLSTVYQLAYRLSSEDVLDLLRFTHDKTLNGNRTHGSKLFSTIVNYLQELYSWRASFNTTIKVLSARSEQLAVDMAVMDGNMNNFLAQVQDLIQERRELGIDGVQVTQRRTAFSALLSTLNAQVVYLTTNYDVYNRASFKSDHMRKAQHGFPTKTNIELEQLPAIPEPLIPGLTPRAAALPAPTAGLPTGAPAGPGAMVNTATQQFQQGRGGGFRGGRGRGDPRRGRGGGDARGGRGRGRGRGGFQLDLGGPTPGEAFGQGGGNSPQTRTQSKTVAPLGYGGAIRAKAAGGNEEGQLKRARWTDEELDLALEEDLEPVFVKRRKVSVMEDY